jgi:predicted dehydrogenase
MPQPIRCGILGTGHAHAAGKLNVLRKSGDWEVVGVCEPDQEWRARSQSLEPFASARWVSEADLLKDESVRMVAIESEVPQLLGLAAKAIGAGKHIHLDKPAGTSLGEFRDLLAEAERRRLIVQMGYMFRYNSGFDLVRRAVSEGWLGDIHYVHGTINSSIQPEARKPLAFHPGGMMFELACHLLDMLVLLMGRPRSVTPFLRHDAACGDGLADNTLAVLEFECAIAVIESSAMEVGAQKRRLFEVCGSRGTVILQPLEPPEARLYLEAPAGGYQAGWQRIVPAFTPRYERDVAELARCIRGEQEFPYSKGHDSTVQETVLRACGVETA